GRGTRCSWTTRRSGRRGSAAWSTAAGTSGPSCWRPRQPRRHLMYQLTRTVPVNEPGQPVLTRHDVWSGLIMKANNALPYVPQMKKCEVVEQGQGWLLRDILLGDEPLRERVTFEPERRVIFERVLGKEPGRIVNNLGEVAQGDLHLTFAFSLTRQGLDGSAQAE